MSLAISLNAASAISTDHATFSGTTSGFGADVPTVTLYWGETDGGTNPGLWANSFFVGFVSGAYSKIIDTLNSYTYFFFRAAASNATDGVVWSGGRTFMTPPTPVPTIDATAASLFGTPLASRTMMASWGGMLPQDFVVSRHYFGARTPINTYGVDNARLVLSTTRDTTVGPHTYNWVRTWTTDGPPALRYDTSNVGRAPEDLSIGTRLIPGNPPALDGLFSDFLFAGEPPAPDNGWLLLRGKWDISVQTTIDPLVTGPTYSVQILASAYRNDVVGAGKWSNISASVAVGSGTNTTNFTADLHADPLWDMMINVSCTSGWLSPAIPVGTTPISLVVQLTRS